MIERTLDFEIVYKDFLYPHISIISNGQQIAYVRADQISPSDFAKIAFQYGFTDLVKFLPEKLQKSYNYLNKIILATKDLDPSKCVYDFQRNENLYAILSTLPSFRAITKATANKKTNFSQRFCKALERERKNCSALANKINEMPSGIVKCVPDAALDLGK